MFYKFEYLAFKCILYLICFFLLFLVYLKMFRDFLKNDPKIPFLSYHSMTLCNNLTVIYGGIISNDNINGDLIFLKSTGKTFTIASYEKNKTGNIYYLIK